ncbi:SMI1/KNR4 family protein [Taylorella equigenitalis]|nr:SMI1/KNR4 family protein [Taylorella equigenitalis]KOS59325.1 hypothetical protein AM589_01835 [Taylorella equigenitalis]
MNNMNEQEVIDTFTKLVEGKLSTEQWKIWVSENAGCIEDICGRTSYLKLKPSKSFSDARNIYYGQIAVSNWLKSKNVEFSWSDRYKLNYEKESDSFRNKLSAKRNKFIQNITNNFSYLNQTYPKLFNQISGSFDEDSRIEVGKSLRDILSKEKELSTNFPEDLKEFFKNISLLEFESVNIDFDNLDTFTYENREYIVLGEFGLYADGDKILYDSDNNRVSIFAHEFNPPQVKKQAKNMKEFVEKVLVKFLKEYGE